MKGKGPLRVGITGGIGSGKSTVCRMFAALGIPVYYADDAAKWLITHDPALVAEITRLFGPEAYVDGVYNRAFVAQIVFSNSEKLAALNALVHPAVERHSRAWHHEQTANGAPYTLKEAALMIESGSHQYLDLLIVVTAPEALRIQRVVSRDGLTAAEVQARMAHQWPQADKVALANFVINNDGQHALIPQVWATHRAIVQLGD